MKHHRNRAYKVKVEVELLGQRIYTFKIFKIIVISLNCFSLLFSDCGSAHSNIWV